MTDLTPTRSHAIQLGDEQRTMREGAAFLDEKCLLLAGEMLRELHAWRRRRADAVALLAAAQSAFAQAAAVHGTHGLQVYTRNPVRLALRTSTRHLLGVPINGPVQVTLHAVDATSDHGTAATACTPVHPSIEAQHCAQAYRRLFEPLAALAEHSANLSRLYQDYRRTVRRLRALQDVLLPELERDLRSIVTALDEFEQDEAAMLRHSATGQRGFA